MSDINVKAFNDLVQSLKKMLWGVQVHKNDSGFPRDVTEDALNELIRSLETTRTEYEANIARTKQLGAAYHASVDHGVKNLSRFTSQICDFYGKGSRLVGEFGLKSDK
ncbi:MAG: hypothetical protein JXD23_17740 [Spirochaetales bacterium]|nr:hypothetical protein [Spirochaetales bacterium]